MKKFLVLFALLGLFVTACDDDEEVIGGGSVEGTPSLKVELNASAFMSGDTVTATITDISDPDVTRGNITLNFSIINLGTSQFDHSMFSTFPETATFSASATEMTVDFVLGDIEDTYSLRLVTEAEGCAVSGANQNFTVSTAYLVNLSVTDSSNGVVNEGDTFTITASTESPADEALTVVLSFEAGSEDYLSPLPASITIPAGENSAESEEITMLEDSGEYQAEMTFSVDATVNNSHYEVADALVITRKDKDSGKGEYLTDEKWVYDDPTQSFVSSGQLDNFTNGGGVNYVIMSCYNKDSSGSSHPNAELATEGWELINATEFHYGVAGWGLPSTALNDGRYGVTTQNGYAQDNTKQQQNYCWMTAHNNGTDGSLYFQNTVEGGYFRMFSVFQDGYTGGNGDGSERKIAAEAIKCCTGSAVPGWGPISQGTRVEVRAKVGGNRQGYNYAIKIKDNAGRDWPIGGEIDLFQNPVFTSEPGTTNNVYQGVYYGGEEDHAHPEYQTNDVNPEEWNIYWAEIVDDTTVRLGINGSETLKVTSSDEAAYTWPFTDLFNTSYFYLVLETGVGVAVDTNDSEDYLISGEWADSSIKSISFEEAQTNDTAPHMYVDWVRIWCNNGSEHKGAANVGGTFF